MSIAWLFVKKIAIAVGTVVVVSVAVFAVVAFLPQDPATAALGHEATPAQKAEYRHRMGLDRPLVVRYLRWSADFVQGDFGRSVISSRSITRDVLTRAKYTLILATLSLVVGVLIGLASGVVVGQRAGGPAAMGASLVAVAVAAVPEFVIAFCLIYVFAVELALLPVVSTGVASGQVDAYVLPVLTLAVVTGAYVFRFARVSTSEAMNSAHTRSAVLKGFSNQQVLLRHVLPVSSIVVVNAVAINAIYLLGGVVVIENVFAYPGLGRMLVEAISDNDFVVILSVSVMMSAMFVTITFIADAVTLVLDPRLRASS